MRERIPVSAVRARLSRVLRQLEDDPSRVYEITVNGRVVGELRAPESRRLQIRPGSTLLDALDAIGQPETEVRAGSAVAREHNRFLYTPSHKDRTQQSL